MPFLWPTPDYEELARAAAGASLPREALDTPLHERPAHTAYPLKGNARGRRLRCFVSLVSGRRHDDCTWGEWMTQVERGDFREAWRKEFSALPLTGSTVMMARQVGGGVENRIAIHHGLQDLADEVNEDIREAREAAAYGTYYAGVNNGIDPVPDDHVRLVMWGMQRELDRELRPGKDGARLPAVKLDALPWPIQRALAERRRLRIHQWGISREAWAKGVWSLWDVPVDQEFMPRRLARLREQA